MKVPWMTTPASMAGLGEPAHLLELDPFLDVLEDLAVAAFVADEEQAQAAVFEELDGVGVEIGAAVAGPGQAERARVSWRSRGRAADWR